MTTKISRRRLIGAGAAASLTALLPKGVFSQGAATKKAVIHGDQPVGIVRPEFHGHFAEHLGSCVYGGLWVGKNSPIPNINGFRRAAVEYLKELGVPVLRWPGGCFADDYHWRHGIGPVAKRQRIVNSSWGGYIEDNSFGTHEFIELCRMIGAEPYLAANVGTGSPEEMRDWIEYCNQPNGSTLANERAANGSPDPFKIRYWGVGNELWGCGGNYRADGAGAEFRRYATFAKTFGGVRPYLVGCGPSGNNSNWTRGFLDALAGFRFPDGLSIHSYQNGTMEPTKFTPEAMYTQFNMFPRVEQAITQQRALVDGYDNGRRMGIIFDEWGVWDRIPAEDERRNGRLWQQSTMRSAVAAALGLNAFNRLADKLYMCNIAQMVNVLQSVLLTDGPEGKNCVRTTTYYAFMLFKAHRSKTAVRVETDAPVIMPAMMGGAGRGGRGGQPEAPPELSISASREGAEMVVTLVNPRHDTAMQVECALRGLTASAAKAQILHDADINAFNAFEAPDRITIKPHEAAVENGTLRVALPAMSVVTVTLKVA